MASCGMEVDPPSVSSAASTLGLNPLKRSNSAPMINVLVSTANVTSATTTIITSTNTPAVSISTVSCPSETAVTSGGFPEARVRRFSTSSMALHSPTTPVKTRLIQIKQEETLNQVQVEAAHEREVQMTQQIVRNWDNFQVDETHVGHSESARRPKSLGEPLHIQTCLYGNASSPSPTRGLGKQCFSPSLQQPVPGSVLSPTPSPSPTRKTFRRSASPITLRPSPLGVKRKMEMDWSDRPENYFSPPKRFHTASHSPGGSTPERAGLGVGPLLTHPLLNSTSSSNPGGSDGGHTEHRVPTYSTPMTCSPAGNSFGHNVGTNSTTSTPSPCYMFRAVRDSVESTHGTDSETSDMTETTDISEHTENSINVNENSVNMADVGEGACSSHSASTADSFSDSPKSMGPPPVSDIRGLASQHRDQDSHTDCSKNRDGKARQSSCVNTQGDKKSGGSQGGTPAGDDVKPTNNTRAFASLHQGQICVKHQADGHAPTV